MSCHGLVEADWKGEGVIEVVCSFAVRFKGDHNMGAGAQKPSGVADGELWRGYMALGLDWLRLRKSNQMQANNGHKVDARAKYKLAISQRSKTSLYRKARERSNEGLQYLR